MGSRLDVTYKHDKKNAKPRSVSNEDIRRLAQDVRWQIGCGDRLRIGADDLFAINEINANGITYELSWSVDGPVTNEQGQPVLGLCEHNPDDFPNTALIFANPDAVASVDGLLISTLAHEFGHGIFDAPGWIVAAQTSGLPGLYASSIGQRFHTETPDELHLGQKRPKQHPPDFPEWRANEFMGSLLVPRDQLVSLLKARALMMSLPVEEIPPVASLVPADSNADIRIARELGRRDRNAKLPSLINALASEFGVSRRFMEVRLLRYGLVEEAQLVTN
jgi:hypothetical protein